MVVQSAKRSPIEVQSVDSKRQAPDIAADCRHYRGDRPCIHNRLCHGCEHYEPFGGRICIIKIGALGDVIRTLCILPELCRRHPRAQITWVSNADGCRMIADHPMIDRTVPFDATWSAVLAAESFDLLISLDKEAQPCALATTLKATNKLGIALSRHGTTVPLNDEAAYYFKLGLSDQLKFEHNRKSYPQLVYEALGWQYSQQRYELPVDGEIRTEVFERLSSRGWQQGRETIGINVGAGSAFANKMWPARRIAEVITGVRLAEPHAQILLLGGPRERAAIDDMLARLESCGGVGGVYDAGTDHDEKRFVAVVDACDVLFAGDTMAMHVAVARGKGVVAFFGPTCPQEIDLFGKGEKLIARAACSPCYKRVCDQGDECVGELPTAEAVKAITRVLALVGGRRYALPIAPMSQAG